MRHLVLLSGGPDSALALQRALTETDEPVVALHVQFVGTDRAPFELASCKKIVAHLREKIRDFDFLIGRMDPPRDDRLGRCFSNYADQAVLCGHAAMVCGTYGDIGKTWAGHDPSVADGCSERTFLLGLRGALYSDRTGIKAPKYHDPDQYGQTMYTKAETKELLGEELWNLCHSCRKPKHGKPCGECEACMERINDNVW